MNLHGLSDSVGGVIESPAKCRQCGATTRLGNGLCLSCTLREGLEGDRESSRESFEAILAEDEVQDTHWRVGNYEILEEIGRGGMGVIYRARQRHSRRIVALKRILGFHADSRETLARFRREAEAAASLDHPNILPIFEVSESEEGLPFFSMKFAAGGSLWDAARSLRDDPRRIVALIAKVTRAVQYAHVQGILHRDLKPGNIMLDGRGEPLVSDFGLAKWLDTSSDLTRTLTIFGTPGYIAPEQARRSAANLTPAADVYSLGAMLFDLFAGRPPFLGEHALAVIHQASEQSAPKLRSIIPGFDRDLETICAKCLEREPQARYRTAGDLAEDLERWLEGHPIIARPVLPPVHIWRWSKRNRKLAGSIAACLVAIAAATVWQVQSRHLSATVREGQLATRSVAVIPFLNLDDARADDSIAIALAQSLQASLSRFGPVQITSVSHGAAWAGTGSVDDLNEANRESKSRAILTGTERIVHGKNVRLSIRLMNATTGEALLTRSLEVAPGISPVQALEKAIAPGIYPILNARDWSTIAPSARDPGMRNPAAREFIITGRQLIFRYTLEDFDRSISCLEKALAIEPNSALAHAYLSSSAVSRAHFVPDRQLLDRGEGEAKEALRLEPDLPEADRALAGVFYQKNDFANALEEQLRAIEVGGPEEHGVSLIGMILIALGQPVRALGWLEMAKHWASRPGDYDALIGDCWSLLAEDERAQTAYRRATDLRPEASEGWIGLAHLRLLQRDFEDARKVCRENNERFKDGLGAESNPAPLMAQIEFFARRYPEAERIYDELVKKDPSGGIAFYGSVTYSSALGRLHQIRGDHSAASAILKQSRELELAADNATTNPAVLYRIAAIESSLGDTESAILRLRAAIKNGWIDYRSLGLDPRFDGITADPRFQQMLSALATKVAELRRQVGQPTKMASNSETTSP